MTIFSEGFLECCSLMPISPYDQNSFLPMIDVVTYSPGLVLSFAGNGMDIPYVHRTILLAQLIAPSLSLLTGGCIWKTGVWSTLKGITF